jgi:hypothetical protein
MAEHWAGERREVRYLLLANSKNAKESLKLYHSFLLCLPSQLSMDMVRSHGTPSAIRGFQRQS